MLFVFDSPIVRAKLFDCVFAARYKLCLLNVLPTDFSRSNVAPFYGYSVFNMLRYISQLEDVDVDRFFQNGLVRRLIRVLLARAPNDICRRWDCLPIVAPFELVKLQSHIYEFRTKGEVVLSWSLSQCIDGISPLCLTGLCLISPRHAELRGDGIHDYLLSSKVLPSWLCARASRCVSFKLSGEACKKSEIVPTVVCSCDGVGRPPDRFGASRKPTIPKTGQTDPRDYSRRRRTPHCSCRSVTLHRSGHLGVTSEFYSSRQTWKDDTQLFNQQSD